MSWTILAVGAPAVPPSAAPALDLHFIAIGSVPPDLFETLVSEVRARFRLPITTLPPLALDQTAIDTQRSQVVADRLIQAVRFRYPSLAKNPRARIIGITPVDMFMEAMRQQWRFTFSLRSPDGKVAVVSYARMDPSNYGLPPDDELRSTRLRKMVTKNIGIICYGLAASRNPRSVMFGNILGVDDLDRMTEEFDPK